MSLADYDGLKAELAAYSARSDLTANLDTFIDIAEARFNRRLRVSAMEATSSISTVAGTATIDLPSDFKHIKLLEFTSTPKQISFITQSKLTKLYAGASSGRPTFAARYPGNKLILGPTPDAVYALTLSYYQEIPALSSGNTTNWLLTDYPDLYLYACLEELAKYIKDDSDIANYRTMSDEIIAQMMQEENESTQPMQGMAMWPEVVV